MSGTRPLPALRATATGTQLIVDGRYLSTEVAGGMTGRMVGVACRDGSVVVRSFEYVGADDPAALA